MNKLIYPVLGAVLLTGFSGCGLRNAVLAEKQSQADQAAEHSHDLDKQLSDQDAADQLSDLEIHRKYFLAIEGDYEGTETPISKDDPSAPPMQTTISAQFQLENDLAQFSGTEPLTSAQVTAADQALSFTINVEENAQVTEKDGTTTKYQISCVQANVRPDFESGIINFTCQNSAAGTGRVYSFSLDEQGLSPQAQRSPENVSDLAAETSAQLLNGTSASVDKLNVQIMTPFGTQFQFFGQLTRKNSSNNK